MNNSSNIFNLLLRSLSVGWELVIVGVTDHGGTTVVVVVGLISTIQLR